MRNTRVPRRNRSPAATSLRLRTTMLCAPRRSPPLADRALLRPQRSHLAPHRRDRAPRERLAARPVGRRRRRLQRRPAPQPARRAVAPPRLSTAPSCDRAPPARARRAASTPRCPRRMSPPSGARANAHQQPDRLPKRLRHVDTGRAVAGGEIDLVVVRRRDLHRRVTEKSAGSNAKSAASSTSPRRRRRSRAPRRPRSPARPAASRRRQASSRRWRASSARSVTRRISDLDRDARRGDQRADEIVLVVGVERANAPSPRRGAPAPPAGPSRRMRFMMQGSPMKSGGRQSERGTRPE